MKKSNLQEPLDTSKPIDVFFKIIDNRVQYDSEANTLILLEQVL